MWLGAAILNEANRRVRRVGLAVRTLFKRTGESMTTRVVAAAGLVLAALAAHSPVQAQSRAEERACAALAGEPTGSTDLTISEARFYTNRTIAARPGAETTLPPHCHVAGSFERRTGVDDKDYAIGFAINMPAEWNGRFVFQGGGGLNGSIREPTGSQAAGERSALERGFAVVATDSGHQGSARRITSTSSAARPAAVKA
jgi:hypothetical protein